MSNRIVDNNSESSLFMVPNNPPIQAAYRKTSQIPANMPTLVLNPFDRSYAYQQNAFLNYQLNPNQATANGYYTISTGYGPCPIQSQTTRSCSGGF